jgi:iron-sulfur cluster repair protein YtfE (RIC family)
MTQLFDKNACDLLDADHIAVKHLFVEYARMAAANTAPPAIRGTVSLAPADDDRAALARSICAELTVHAQIEEEIFYPALRDAIDTPELLDLAEEEHQEAKELIAQIQAQPQADAEMDALVAALACAIETHVQEERDLLFPKARSAAALDLDALGAQLKARQQELMSEQAALA